MARIVLKPAAQRTQAFREASVSWVANEQQRLINEKNERRHGTSIEPSGQMRWTHGNFESRKAL